MRRRLEQAGFPKTTPRSFWMICGIVARAWPRSLCILTHQKPLVIVLAAFVRRASACRAGCWAS